MACVMTYAQLPSPLGPLLAVSDGSVLTGLYAAGHPLLPSPQLGWQRNEASFSGVVDQFEAYFNGRLKRFDVPLLQSASAFQRLVWATTGRISFGDSISLQALAQRLERPTAVAAIRRALAACPYDVIVPSHRVKEKDGAPLGLPGRHDLHQRLLRLEQRPKALTPITTYAVRATSSAMAPAV
jgi:methylated-DNA-[protein]-cysteine S-methyltransferase